MRMPGPCRGHPSSPDRRNQERRGQEGLPRKRQRRRPGGRRPTWLRVACRWVGQRRGVVFLPGLPAVWRVGVRREGCGITRVRPSWEAALLYRHAVDMGMRQEDSKRQHAVHVNQVTTVSACTGLLQCLGNAAYWEVLREGPASRRPPMRWVTGSAGCAVPVLGGR